MFGPKPMFTPHVHGQGEQMRQRGRKNKAREISDTNIRVGKRYFHRPRRTVSKFPKPASPTTRGKELLAKRLKVQQLRTYYFKQTSKPTPPEPEAHEHTNVQLLTASKFAAVALAIAFCLILSVEIASTL